MKPTKAALVLLSAMVLMACGGGGGGSDPTTDQPPLPPPPPPAAAAFDPAAAAALNTNPPAVPNVGDPQIAMDAAGNALAVYTQSDGVRRNVFARRFDAATGQFEAQQLIGQNSGGGTSDLRVKFSAQGNAMAIWTQEIDDNVNNESNVVAAFYNAASKSWAPAKRLTSNNSQEGIDVRDPDVAFGADGTAIAAWTERKDGGASVDVNVTLASRLTPGASNWSPPEIVENLNFGSDRRHTGVRIAVLSGDDIMLAAIEQKVDSSGPAYVALYRYFNAKGGWGFGNIVTGGTSNEFEDAPLGDVRSLDLAANAAGQVTIVFEHEFTGSGERNAIFTSRLTDSGAWSPVTLVDTGASLPNTQNKRGKDSFAPRVVLDAAGTATFAWFQEDEQGSNSVRSVYASRQAASAATPGAPTLIETNADNVNAQPSISNDKDGNVFVAWAQLTSSGVGAGSNIYSLFASRYTAATDAFSAPALVEADDTATIQTTSHSTAMAPDGTALTVWSQANKIMFNRFK